MKHQYKILRLCAQKHLIDKTNLIINDSVNDNNFTRLFCISTDIHFINYRC